MTLSKSLHSSRGAIWVFSLLVAFTFLVLAAPAEADIVFGGTQGPGAGQTDEPTAIAVDRSNGTVYVADGGNRRIDVFGPNGNFLRAFGWGVADGTTATLQACTTTCFQGLSGFGAGQFKGPTKIAVDNDATSPAFHDIYVIDAGNNRVQRFAPTGAFVLAFGDGVNQTTGGDVCTAVSGDTCRAGTSGGGAAQFSANVQLTVGPGGIVHVADSPQIGPFESEGFANRAQKFDPAGTLIGQVVLSQNSDGRLQGLAVDSTGDIYVATGGVSGAVRKHDPSGALLATFPASFNIHALAIDGVDNLFVADSTGNDGGTFPDGSIGSEAAIYEYDVNGTPTRTFYGNGTLVARPVSLAPYANANGDIFALESPNFDGRGLIAHLAFPPPGPVIPDDPSLLKADSLGSVRAVLRAMVNPEGNATTVKFQYVDDAAYQDGGFSNPATEETPEGPPTPPSFKLQPASVSILCAAPGDPGCLSPNTTYHFRVIATNADAPGGRVGPEATFKTLPPIQLGDSWSTEVGLDNATLHAEVNPTGIPTTGYFEYVDEATYQQDAASGDGFQRASRAPDFSAGATLLDFGSGEIESERSTSLLNLQPDTAYRYRLIATDFFGVFTGPERAFSTFPSISGAPTCPGNQAFRTGLSAVLPNCRAYEMVSPLEKNNGDIVSPRGSNRSTPASYYQAATDGDGVSYSSAKAFPGSQSAPYVSQYLASRDPGTGWSSRSIAPPRETNVEPGLPEIKTLNDEFVAFSADLSSSWLWHTADPPLGTPPGVEGYWNLYRRDNDTDEYEALTTVKPPIAPSAGSAAYIPALQGFSADESHVVYTANDMLTPNASSALDAEDNPIQQLYEYYDGGKLRLVSVLPNGTANPTGASAGTGGNGYCCGNFDHAVSEDGTRVFWTAADSGSGKLYLRLNSDQAQSAIVGGKCTDPAKACTVAVSGTVSSADARFWAADPAGTKVLFTVGGSEAGGMDLYSFDVATAAPTLIAGGVRGLLGAAESLSRVYFTSTAFLAPGATTGQLNLYLYETGQGFTYVATLADGESGDFADSNFPFSRASRVSGDGLYAAFISSRSLTGYDNADASNGKAATELYRYDAEAKSLDCVSCNPSGARPAGRESPGEYKDYYDRFGPAQVAAQIPGWQTSFYAQRILSDDGNRLYFESFDSLLPRDTNGRLDVYQWEAPESGDCDTESASYFVQNGGCLSLISAGTSAGDSSFVDASSDGEDVFFTTEASLVSQDYGLVDVYDARVDGGFPPPPSPPAGCEGEACQGPPTPPADPTPASSSFEGGGNVRAIPASCRRGKVRRKGRCVKRRPAKPRRGRASDRKVGR